MPIANSVPVEAAVVVTEAGLDQPPGVDREPLAIDRDRAALACHAQRLLEVVDDDVGTRRDQRFPVATAVDADHQRRSRRRGPAATPEMASSTTTASAGVDAEALGGVDEHRRVGLPGEVLARRATTPSTTAAKRSAMPAARSTVPAFFDDDTMALGTRRVEHVHHPQRSRIGRDPSPGEHGVEHLVLAVAQCTDRVVARSNTY